MLLPEPDRDAFEGFGLSIARFLNDRFDRLGCAFAFNGEAGFRFAEGGHDLMVDALPLQMIIEVPTKGMAITPRVRYRNGFNGVVGKLTLDALIRSGKEPFNKVSFVSLKAKQLIKNRIRSKEKLFLCRDQFVLILAKFVIQIREFMNGEFILVGKGNG